MIIEKASNYDEKLSRRSWHNDVRTRITFEASGLIDAFHLTFFSASTYISIKFDIFFLYLYEIYVSLYIFKQNFIQKL